MHNNKILSVLRQKKRLHLKIKARHMFSSLSKNCFQASCNRINTLNNKLVIVEVSKAVFNLQNIRFTSIETKVNPFRKDLFVRLV